MSKGKYLDSESVAQIQEERRERREAMDEARKKAAFDRAVNWAMLIGTCFGIIYMITHSLIDLKIGLVLLAAASAFFGRGTK